MKRVALVLVSAVVVLAAPLALAGKEPNDEVADNEASAVGSLRSLNTAQVYYARAYAEVGFACALESFSPPPDGQRPSPNAADLLDRGLTSGTKAGYRSTLTCPDKAKPQKKYQLSAVPVAPGQSGKRAFCTDETAVIKGSDDGKAETCFASGKPL